MDLEGLFSYVYCIVQILYYLINYITVFALDFTLTKWKNSDSI